MRERSPERKKCLSMAMVRRLRARFHVPADLLIPEAEDKAAVLSK